MVDKFLGKSSQLLCFAVLLVSIILLVCAFNAHALFVSPAKDPLPLIEKVYPQATKIGDKQGEPLVRPIYQHDTIIAYAFETNDIANIPAYSGEPVNMLVILDPKGNYVDAKVLEHHEPIILAGIPESKLDEFAAQYKGLSVSDRLKVGGSQTEGSINIDGLSGATVTVMVMNLAIVKAANKAAVSLGIIEPESKIIQPVSSIKQDVFERADWLTLTGDGSIRKLYLTRARVDQAFVGTDAEFVENAEPDQKQDQFAEVYFTLADIPTIGRNLLGDLEYEYQMQQLKPGEHLIALLGNGYSFKGSGYVRGGIFDRIQLHQHDEVIAFRDLDHQRLTDLYISGAPSFKEMALFRVAAHHEFDPGAAWQFELLVRRQTGPVDSIFSRFKGQYEPIAKYLDTPAAIMPEPELTLVQQVWQEKETEVSLIAILVLVLLLILFFQDVLVKYPNFMHRLRHGFLLVTVVAIGWIWGGQLSVVNVFTFLNSLMTGFSWDLFLLDPVIFTLWCAAAVTLVLWGRAVYCGWLCPFGALQELVNVVGRRLKFPQIELPFVVHERLWAIKYLILLALFGLSLDSLALAEQFAELEPFKTVFSLKFDRQWPFVLYASALILINLINRKTFCRYLCPLGAALSVSNGIRLFDWLKRRKECGTPCQTCAKECEIQAIYPSGEINMRECHYCLDCQVTYYDEDKCPPLKKMAYKRRKNKQNEIPITQVA